MNSSQGWATAMEKDIAMQKAIQKTEISKAQEDEEEDVKCKIQKVALDKDDLKCPACLNYLRPDRIYQCSKGHMICSICKPRHGLEIRSFGTANFQVFIYKVIKLT